MGTELCDRCLIGGVCDLPGCMRPQPPMCGGFVSKPTTNYDRLHGMNMEKLAKALCYCGCPCFTWKENPAVDCPIPQEDVREEICSECWLSWLKQEADGHERT